MNYASSMGFALAFLLTGLGLVTMHHCHNNLLGVQIRFTGAKPVFAGQACRFRLTLKNHSRAQRCELTLRSEDFNSPPLDLAPEEMATVAIEIPARRRGRTHLQRVTISSRFPGNLFRAWSWLHMSADCIVYPQTRGTRQAASVRRARSEARKAPANTATPISPVSERQSRVTRHSTSPGRRLRVTRSSSPSSSREGSSELNGWISTRCPDWIQRRDCRSSLAGAWTPSTRDVRSD